MSRIVTKPTKWHVRPAKTQISLGIHPVWSESSLFVWRKLESLATHLAHSKDSDQTGRMPRLIWVFAGRKCHFVGLVTMGLKCRPFFHALTGCDTTSFFLGHGKWSTWEAWVSCPAASVCFEQLCTAPDRTSTCTNMARFIYEEGSINGKTFTYAGGIATTYSKITYQGSHIWRQVMYWSFKKQKW